MLLGLPVSAVGLALRAWAAGHLSKDRELAVSGPYAYLRNPLYAGTLVAASGLVVASENKWLAITAAIVFTLVYLPAIELEEQHLREIFPEYEKYAASVSRLLPGRKYLGSVLAFSGSSYLRNEEYKAVVGWSVAVAWLIWRSRLL
jgi:protein-S-isoprenylcysteine O-methyltransferase Ste14